MYENLRISNFRGIDELNIDELSRINLFVGANNSGKTSVLEALFLLSGAGNPRLPTSINSFRSLKFVSDNVWRSFFNRMNVSSPIVVDGLEDAVAKKLSISAIADTSDLGEADSHSPNDSDSSSQAGSKATSESSIVGLDLLYEEVDSQAIRRTRSQVFQEKRDVRTRVVEGKVEPKRALFTNDLTITYSEIALRLERMLVDKKDQVLIDVARKLDSSVSGFVLGANGTIFVDTGLSKMLPVQLLGNGMVKLLVVNLNAYEARNGMLLIDEIDNGLHHSSLGLLWKSLIRSAINYDVQIVATTHSYECIKALVDSSEGESVRNMIRVFRTEIADDNINVKVFDRDALTRFIEREWEVR